MSGQVRSGYRSGQVRLYRSGQLDMNVYISPREIMPVRLDRRRSDMIRPVETIRYGILTGMHAHGR